MGTHWVRTGDLRDIASYPRWVQEMVADMQARKEAVATHRLFRRMSDAVLPHSAVGNFLIRVWPLIEQFPQYMGRNIAKLEYGRPGHDLTRTFLTRNVRVEQHHADYWVDWAEASGLARDELLRGSDAAASAALSHWCWYICDRGPLSEAMAATNYAIEGVTGEWAQLICSTDKYAESLPCEKRKTGMRWLRAHARYDDSHPWEALEIVATLLGASPSMREIHAVRVALQRSYDYMLLTLEDCMREPLRAEVEEIAAEDRAA